jgi:hypothetical protein
MLAMASQEHIRCSARSFKIRETEPLQELICPISKCVPEEAFYLKFMLEIETNKEDVGNEPEPLLIFCFDKIIASDHLKEVSFGEVIVAVAKEVFSKETLVSLLEYGSVLKDIHNRLISEGYIWRNGKFYKK